MDTLINNASKIMAIAFEECCLDCQVSFSSISGGVFCGSIVHIIANYSIGGKKLKIRKIQAQATIPDNGNWNEEIEIWTTMDNGITLFKQCHITKLIDLLMETKKALA